MLNPTIVLYDELASIRRIVSDKPEILSTMMIQP